MTMRRAAPGPQVSSGRLRVDAARAIAKLREYQLADRAAWILEGIRAAVASSATEIALDGDANDIWLSWSGPVWDAALLPRLFDELVSPEPAEELQHVRLLAAAVNSALGMDPAYVDVYAITAPGTAQRVRYTPDVLAEPTDDLGNAPLRHVAVEVEVPPRDAAVGMLVHLRRRVSFEVLGYVFREPPELRIARANCRDIAVPLTVGKLALHRSKTTDLVRVPLGDGLDGFLAITDPDDAVPRPQLEVAERGVVLATYLIDPFPFQPRCPVPLRVFIDADRLPTNASRSQVRLDIHPISTATRRSTDLAGSLVTALAERARSDERARRAAVQLLAANIAGHPSFWGDHAPVLEPLAVLPLFKTATGKPALLTSNWAAPVYTGSSPLDEDLEPWLGHVLWLRPGDPARALLGNQTIDLDAMRLHARFARKQRRAQRKFLAHAKRDLRVKTSIAPRVRAPLGVALPHTCVPDELFAEARGEVCVYAGGRDAALAVLHDGRELERIELESPIAFDAVIESGLVRPADRYLGVARDEGFQAVNRAMQAGVVRAIEALAMRSDDVELGDSSDRAQDLVLVRKGMMVAKALGLDVQVSPLALASAWHGIDGKELSYADLSKCRAVGVIGMHATLVPPRDRVVVVAAGVDASDLRALFGNRIVSYQHAAGVVQRVTPARLASSMGRSAGAPCLHVRDGELVGAIALSQVPVVRLHHMGLRVQERPYVYTYVRCSISVDSDELIPNNDWTAPIHDAGLFGRSYAEWELRLLQAIVSAIVGEPPDELEAPERIAFDDDTGSVLAKALVVYDPATLLGPELLAKLKAMPLFATLGCADLASIDDLADRFPGSIPYADWSAESYDGFSPLVGSEHIARLVGALAKRSFIDARPELERRKRKVQFESRYASHVAAPAQAIALPLGGASVPIEGTACKGVLGVHADGFEIRILVAGRPFAVHRPRYEGSATQLLMLTNRSEPRALPLLAIIEIAAESCDETFTTVRPEVLEMLEEVVLEQVPALIDATLAREPLLLDSTTIRTLLAGWFPLGRLSTDLRERIRTAPAFRSIQGPRISLADAAMPRLILSTAGWTDTWLEPADGEAQTAFDAPILRIGGPTDELHVIIEYVHANVVQDVSVDVARLQARRRMARGLLPTPKLGRIEALYKRELEKLGAAAAKLGHGEIGLVGASESRLLIHENGEQKRMVDIDVMPTIHLAIEDPHELLGFDAMRSLAQELTIELVRQIVAANVEIPVKFRRSLAGAILSSRIPPSVVGSTPLFMCADGRWLDWGGFQEQLTQHGDVWALTSLPQAVTPPLDETRAVIILDETHIALANEFGQRVIDARIELELDAQARANRAKPRAQNLELPSRTGVLVEVELDGDGTSAPRGTVAILSPEHAARRGILVHRAMQPLGQTDDPCKWPTVSVVDDARITPVRTWNAPKLDESWAAIAKRVRAASEEALATIGQVPDHALTSLRITNHVCADVTALRDAPHALIRGVVWLTGLPFTPTSLQIHHRSGMRAFTAPFGMAIGGWLAVHDPGDLTVDKALYQLCEQTHGKLVRQLLKSDHHDRGTVVAHVAHAIALKSVRPTEVSGIELTCFRPTPISPRTLASIFRNTDAVPIATKSSTDGAFGFIDDGTEVAKVIRVHLGERLFKPSPAARPAPPKTPPPGPRSPPVSTTRPAPAPTPIPAPKPRAPHVLEPLVAALGKRVGKLGVGTYDWVIDERSEKLVSFSWGQLVVGGENPHLRVLAAELASKSILAGPAIDAVVAHAVSVLNLALTDVTNAGESHAIGVLLATPSAKV